MNNNKRPASSPPPEAAPTRPPPFAGVETLKESEQHSRPQRLVGALLTAAKSFNQLTAMLTAQHTHIEALTDRRVHDSFSNSLGKMTAAWQQYLPVDLRTPTPQLAASPAPVTPSVLLPFHNHPTHPRRLPIFHAPPLQEAFHHRRLQPPLLLLAIIVRRMRLLPSWPDETFYLLPRAPSHQRCPLLLRMRSLVWPLKSFLPPKSLSPGLRVPLRV